jgi:hypothetical protein
MTFRANPLGAGEGVAIADWIFGLLIGEGVEVLQDQHSEEQDGINQLVTSIGFSLFNSPTLLPDSSQWRDGIPLYQI